MSTFVVSNKANKKLVAASAGTPQIRLKDLSKKRKKEPLPIEADLKGYMAPSDIIAHPW